MSASRELSPDELREQLKRRPLMGLTAAAGVLGVAAPNVARMRKQGRLPEGVPVEGAAQVYFRSEIEELRDQLAAARSTGDAA